jgi:hypothetical protein
MENKMSNNPGFKKFQARKEEKEKEEKENRRKSVVRGAASVVLVIMLGVLILAIALLIEQESLSGNKWLTFPASISIHQQEVISKALNEFRAKFGCPGKRVSIQNLVERQDSEARSAAGFIRYNLAIILEGELDDVSHHEGTHGCKPTARRLDTPLPHVDGYITGFSGFSPIVIINGEETQFNYCEEGVAERNARLLNPSYQVHNDGLVRLGDFTIEMFPEGDPIMDAFWRNDFEEYVARVLNIPKSSVTSREIQQVMKKCQDIYLGNDF